MTERVQAPPWLAGWRRTCLVMMAIGWFAFDILDGLFVTDEAAEHWLEAAWFAAAIAGFAALAGRRPRTPEIRAADRVLLAALAVFGTTLVMRATLPDAAAFRWSMLLAGGFSAAAILWVRVLNRGARQP